jgi:hypothetical protein
MKDIASGRVVLFGRIAVRINSIGKPTQSYKSDSCMRNASSLGLFYECWPRH